MRPSAYLSVRCGNGYFTAECAESRRGRQRKVVARRGFAAGCEAGLRPAGGYLKNLGLCPPFGPRPNRFRAEPEPRAKPIQVRACSAGHSHRRTSGGAAAACDDLSPRPSA
jgi:hypothetical protein